MDCQILFPLFLFTKIIVTGIVGHVLPRGIITVDDDKLYLIRGGGRIHCLSAVDGKMIWQRDFGADFGGKLMGFWGYSESPLVDGNHIVCTPDGRTGTIVALDKNTGVTVWTSKEWKDNASYASPIVAVVDGVRQYIQQSKRQVLFVLSVVTVGA